MSNHPIIAGLKAALESEREKDANSGHYVEGESCPYYMDEIEAYKDGHEAATERLMAIIESLVSCLERYESLKSYPSMSVDRFGNKFMSVNDLGKDARKVLSKLKEQK